MFFFCGVLLQNRFGFFVLEVESFTKSIQQMMFLPGHLHPKGVI